MAIFRKINSKIENSDGTILIKNISISNDHFYSEDHIINFLDSLNNSQWGNYEIEVLFNYFQTIPRIKEVKFYLINKGVIALIFTDIGGIGKVKNFSRKIALKNKNGYSFSIVEMELNKYQDVMNGKIIVPKSWKLSLDMNKYFDRMRVFFK